MFYSFAAPLEVAGHAEPTPDGVPSVPYTDGLGTYPGGPVSTVAPMGATPPARISFEDLLTARVLENSGRIPDSFLESLRGRVVFWLEHDFAIGGESLVESLRGFRVCYVLSPRSLPAWGQCFPFSLFSGGWIGLGLSLGGWGGRWSLVRG